MPPKNQQPARRRRQKRVKLPVVAVPVSVGPSRRRTRVRGPGGLRSTGPLGLYLASLANPFHISPPKLGYNSFGASGCDTAWFRSYATPLPNGAGQSSFAAICNPMCLSATAGTIGSASLSYLQVISDSLAGNPFSSSAGTAVYAPTDAARLLTEFDSYRVVSAGLRVTVRYPMTVAPGRLFVLNPFESNANFAPLTYTSAASLANAQPIALDGSGVAIAEVRWRPNDVVDFEFLPNSYPTNVCTSKMLVVGVGWTNFSVDIEVISHYEYKSGVLLSSDSLDDSTVSLSTPLEGLVPLVRRLPWWADKTDVRLEDHAFRQAVNSSANRTTKSRFSRTVAEGSRAPEAMLSSEELEHEDRKESDDYYVGVNLADKPYMTHPGTVATLTTAALLGVAGIRAADREVGAMRLRYGPGAA